LNNRLSVLASVEFVPLSESGRKRQPFDGWPIQDGRRVPQPEVLGTHFLPDARFDEHEEPDGYFIGLFIEWKEVAADGLSAVIRFSLRQDDSDRLVKSLHPGSRFTLHEGRRVLARCEVIGEPESIPVSIKLGGGGT
jgi:hypothetical protein